MADLDANSSFFDSVLSTDTLGQDQGPNLPLARVAKKGNMKGSKRRKKMKKNKKNKPKKAMTPFMVFSKETRKLLVAENPSLTFSEIGKELGARWRSLGDKGKEIFVIKARADYQRFLDETEQMEALNPTRKRKTVEQKRQTKVKKSISAYLYFCNAHREQVKAMHPHMKMVEIQRLLADKWMKSPASVKLPFEKQAEADREKFNEESHPILPPSFTLKFEHSSSTLADYSPSYVKQESRPYRDLQVGDGSALDALSALACLPSQHDMEKMKKQIRLEHTASMSVFSQDNLDIS